MDYLIALQTLRESAPSFLNAIFVGISESVLAVGPLIALLVYWCLSKRTGEWMLFSFGWGLTINDTIKIIACVPRPWILDSRLHLPDAAAGSATGFSFPSGHTTCAAATYGTAAVYAQNKAVQRGKRKNLTAEGGLDAAAAGTGEHGASPQATDAMASYRPALAGIGQPKTRRLWLAILLCLLVLGVGFARNWLGVHTLTDVLVALAVAVATTVAMYWVLRLVDAKPKADVWVAAIMLVLMTGIALFAEFSPYPAVHDGAGNLLELDQYTLRTDLWGSLGIAAAVVISWLVERRFIRFTDASSRRERLMRGVFGVVVFALVYLVIAGALTSWIPSAHLAKFFKRFISFLVAGIVVPAGIKWYQNRLAKKAADAA